MPFLRYPRSSKPFERWGPRTLPSGRIVWGPGPSIEGLRRVEPRGPYTPIPLTAEGLRVGAMTSSGPWAYPERSVQGFTGREQQFLREIGDHEGAGYDSAFGMRNGKSRFITPQQFSGKKLTDMTLAEVFAFQDALKEQTRKAGYGIQNGKVVGTSAVGRGQFVKRTLQGLLEKGGPTDFVHTKYTPELQDDLIIRNAKDVGLDPNRADRWGLAERTKLGKQWESLDVSKGKIRPQDLEWVIRRISSQGILKTPPPETRQAAPARRTRQVSSRPAPRPRAKSLWDRLLDW